MALVAEGSGLPPDRPAGFQHGLPGRRGRGRISRLLVAGAALLAAGAASEFLAAYRQGLEAAERAAWREAAVSMRQAIAERPQEKARLAHGFYFRRYLPHYQLGRALYEMGDCEAALAAWAESAAQGVVERFADELAFLERGSERCRQRLAARRAALHRLAAALDEAGAAAAEARRLREELRTMRSPGEVALRERLWEAERLLDEARARREAVAESRDPAALEAAATLAESAARGLAAVAAEGRRLQVGVRERQEDLLGSVETLAAEADELLAAGEYLRPYPAGLRRHRDKLAALAAAARAAGAGAAGSGAARRVAPPRLEELRANLEEGIRSVRWAQAGPPRALTAAAEALFAGDYEKVIELLDEARLGTKSTPHAELLRAAALFALHETADTERPELLAAAEEAVRACRAGDPDRRPLDGWFSPRFIAFFTGVEPAPPAGAAS